MSTPNLRSDFFRAANASGTPAIYIETPRLILREHEAADVDRIHQISNQPGFFYYCFDGSRQKAQDFVDEALRTQSLNPATGMRDNYTVAVVKKDTNELIGHACIERANYIPGVDYEPNYFLDPAHQGGGLGQETLINIVNFAFAGLNLPAMTSTQHPNNTVALHVAQTKIGFKNIACSNVQIQTAAGPQPRLLSIVWPKDFYSLRKNDKMQFISQPAPTSP